VEKNQSSRPTMTPENNLERAQQMHAIGPQRIEMLQPSCATRMPSYVMSRGPRKTPSPCCKGLLPLIEQPQKATECVQPRIARPRQSIEVFHHSTN
jgi:hypothetical protein